MTIIDAVVEIATCSTEIADTCITTLMVLRVTNLFSDPERDQILDRLFAYSDYSSVVLSQVDVMVSPEQLSLSDLADRLQEKVRIMKANRQGVSSFFRKFRVLCAERFEKGGGGDYHLMFECLPPLPDH